MSQLVRYRYIYSFQVFIFFPPVDHSLSQYVAKILILILFINLILILTWTTLIFSQS